MVAKLRDIGWAVVDFKTQKVKRSAKGEPKPAFYETWPLQLAAYQQAILVNSAKDLNAIVSVVIDSAQPGPVHVKHWDGADWADALRYLVMQARFHLTGEPGNVKLARQFDEAVEAGKTPHELLWLARWQEGQKVDKAEVAFERLNSPDFFGETINLTLQ